MQLIQLVPPGGQIFNYCKWRHLVVKFPTSERIFKEVIIVTEVKIVKELKTVKEVKIVKEVKVIKKMKNSLKIDLKR